MLKSSEASLTPVMVGTAFLAAKAALTMTATNEFKEEMI